MMVDDFSAIHELVADLRGAPSEVVPFVKQALRGSAMEMKKDWQERAKVSPGDGFSVAYASSIDFDENDTQTGPEARIGPNLGRNGGSAGFLEDSPGGVLAPPLHAGRDALEAVQEDFERGILNAVADGLATRALKPR